MFSSKLKKLKKLKFRIRSMTYLVVVIGLSVIPMFLVIYAWGFTWLTRTQDPWYLKMQDQLLKIIDHIMAPAVVAGVIAYGAKLVDSDGDGTPDDYQKKEVKDVEKSNTGRHPDHG